MIFFKHMSLLAEVCRLKMFCTDVRKLIQNKVKRFCSSSACVAFPMLCLLTLTNVAQFLLLSFVQRI